MLATRTARPGRDKSEVLKTREVTAYRRWVHVHPRGEIDARVSTIERFAAALGRRIEYRVTARRRTRRAAGAAAHA